MAQAIAADGTKISYQVEGTGETVLLLLTGQANNHRWWDRVRPDFNADFRTLTLDYRGTGDSDRPDTDSYSSRGFAADAIAVLDDGTDDRFNPTANAPLLAERVPGARLELIKDARHAYFEEAREQATSVVLEFLAP